MGTAWRIVPSANAADAFNGEGARLYGGRWNSRGASVVYTSANKSLAALELLVYVNPRRPQKYTAFFVEWDDPFLETLPLTKLPTDWQEHPASTSTKQIGDAWVGEARSAVLAVPSTIIPEELNYLLNPNHTDFKKIKIGKPTDFAFDPRLLI